MSTPLPVREAVERSPRDRPQNVPMDVTPSAVEGFDYYPWSFVTGLKARYLSAWGFPWWLADEESAPVTGSFSTAFSSAFDGGYASPTGAAYSTAFSSAFS